MNKVNLSVLVTILQKALNFVLLLLLVSRVMIAVCAWYCGLLESAVWPSTADFSSLGFL